MISVQAAHCSNASGRFAPFPSSHSRCWHQGQREMPAEASESWNSASQVYAPFEAFTGQFTRAAAAEIPSLLSDSASSGPLRIMDVASGTGASTFALCKTLADHCRQKSPKALVVATDFSEAMLKTLTEKFTASSADPEVMASQAAEKEGFLELATQVADAQDLSAFADGTFDAINCSFGIMFPKSPEKVAREFWRLLKPGGVAVVTTWHYNNMPAEILVDLAHVFKGRGRFDQLPLATATEKFGSEAFMRRLFRGDLEDGSDASGSPGSPLWRSRDLQAKFIAGSSYCLPRHMAAMMNKTPLASDLGHWDEDAVEKHLQDHWTGEDGRIVLQGTALVLFARKPIS